MMQDKQIPLQFSRFDRISLDEFVCGADQQGSLAVRRLIADEDRAPVFLWGRSGTGKSHLLQAACEQLSSTGQLAAYLPLKQHQTLSPEMLDGLEELDLVCLDDVHSICGDSDWEQALFHLYNRLRDSQTRLLMAADVAPTGLAIELNDLKSRLSWGLVLQLHALSEGEMIRALQQRSEQRGFDLSTEVGEYLLRRCPRDMKSLFGILERLDQASLVAQRKVTIPFVKTLLG